jgi:hypothetical protein
VSVATAIGMLSKQRGRGGKPSLDSKFLKGVGKILSSIEVFEIEEQSDTTGIIRLENYEFVASYNWVDAKEPTIYVPGLYSICLLIYVPIFILRFPQVRPQPGHRRIFLLEFYLIRGPSL